MITLRQRALKRALDIVLSFIGLVLFGWLIVLAIVVASIDTKEFGLFMQNRVGKRGVTFRLLKIRTMRPQQGIETNVTTRLDRRITFVGSILRRLKIDELPQLWNVLIGDMSFVGPRPDVEGFVDPLQGDERLLLSVRPGITGPASLKYRDEEMLLAHVADPEKHNREVLWPDKVRINCEYVKSYSLWNDMRYIWRTVCRVWQHE
jgi:lipopolysaccharide/colanic/teichoic acid biosynthesis glycosyltransferase